MGHRDGHEALLSQRPWDIVFGSDLLYNEGGLLGLPPLFHCAAGPRLPPGCQQDAPYAPFLPSTPTQGHSQTSGKGFKGLRGFFRSADDGG